MVKIGPQLIARMARKAKAARRKRTNYNFHKEYSEPIQRLLNVANPGTYVRAHKHENPDKIEVFIALRGRVLILEFNDQGKVRDYFVLDAARGNMGVEISPRVWHSLICLEAGSCLYEVKEGPYVPLTDKNFAPWAPEEGTKEAAVFNRKILKELKISDIR